jgi:hypothetical protein
MELYNGKTQLVRQKLKTYLTLIQTTDGGYLLGGSSDSYSSGDKSVKLHWR